jgi:hypothetical protein
VVDEADDLARAVDHEALDLGLLLGRVGEAGLEREARGAHEGLVDVDLLEQALAERPHDAQRLPADEPARHRDGDPGVPGELRRDPEAVRDDREVQPAATCLEVAGEGEGGGAGVEGDAFAVRDHRRGLPADGLLLGALEALADVEGALRTGPRGRDGTAVRPDEPALQLECREVLADRDAGDAEALRKVRDARSTVLLDEARDELLAFLGEHVGPARIDRHVRPLRAGQVAARLRIRTVRERLSKCQQRI